MDKIRIVIADDEPLARRGIRRLLGPHADISVVGEARNGREAVRILRELRPDLLFLDVHMPALDGFDVLREIGPINMLAVIFVTAYDQFAVRAFDAQALDYLVKPLKESRFKEALGRVRERLAANQAAKLSRKLMALLSAREKERVPKRILVPTSNGDLVLDTHEIDWIEADGYYAAIHACTGRYLLRESLASLAQRLDGAAFLQIHRSAIINVERVREVRRVRGQAVLVLANGVRVPVSRRRRAQVIQVLRRINN